MVKRNTAGLNTESNTQFPDNTEQQITAERFRNFHADQADSFDWMRCSSWKFSAECSATRLRTVSVKTLSALR